MRLSFFDQEVFDQKNFKLSEIIVCKKDDLEFLEYVITESSIKPIHIFYISPAASDYVDLVLIYIKAKFFPSAKFNHELGCFLFEIVDSINNIKLIPETNERLIANFIKKHNLYRDVVESFIEVTKAFNNILTSMYLSNELYGVISGPINTNSWSQLGLNQTKLNFYIEQLNFQKKYLKDLFLDSLLSLKKQSSMYKPSEPERNCLLFSAYCFTSSQHHYNSKNYVTSIMLVHRALDYFLQFFCIKKSLISIKNNGLSYLDSADMITLYNSYKVLKRSGLVVFSDQTNNDIVWLNNRRNNLITTHSVYGCDKDSCLRSIDKVRDLLLRVFPDEGRSWLAICENFDLGVEVNLVHVMDSIFDFDSAFVKKQLNHD